MTPSRSDPRGTYLPTGLRIVGKDAARLFGNVAPPPVEEISRGRSADALYALECTVQSSRPGRSVIETVLGALTTEIRLTWPDCPDLRRDTEASRPPTRFGGLKYRTRTGAAGTWVGEVTWRSVHPMVAGAPITTTVVVEERRSTAHLAVQVTADEGIQSVRGYVGAGQAQPAFLGLLRGQAVISWQGRPVAAQPIPLGGVPRWISSVLEPEDRGTPVAVLAPTDDGTYVVDPELLAWELLGRATLHLLRTPRQSFELTDAVGDRRMSCFRGALRCYYPGWSRHDDPLRHSLLLGDRVDDPVIRATWMGEVGLWLARRTELPPSFEEREGPKQSGAEEDAGPTVVVGGPKAPDLGIDSDSHPGAPPAPPAEDADGPAGSVATAPAAGDLPVGDATLPVLQRLGDQIQVLAGLVRDLLASNEDLTDEVERLRTIAAVRSSSTNAIERRLGKLEDLLSRTLLPPEAFEGARAGAPVMSGDGEAEEEDGRLSLVDVVRTAAELHSNTLLFLDSAYEAAADSPYEDPDRVRAVLDAMARVARRRRDGALGTALREAFSDLGIDYRGTIARSTSARLRQQYQFVGPGGEKVEAVEHIVLGNTYDPRRCLRIYFSSREPQEARFVIGHVGRHFEVLTST